MNPLAWIGGFLCFAALAIPVTVVWLVICAALEVKRRELHPEDDPYDVGVDLFDDPEPSTDAREA